jgi:hypothetical protein
MITIQLCYHLISFQWGYFVSAVEWLVFVCTHTKGTDWKTAFNDAPPLVKGVMSAGKKWGQLLSAYYTEWDDTSLVSNNPLLFRDSEIQK